MSSRLPIVLVNNLQLPNAYAPQFTGTDKTFVTLSSVAFNNTSASPVAISVSLVPAGGTQGVANEVVTNLVIPAAGAAPTQISALIGQHIVGAGMLEMKAATAAVITAQISGYLTTP
jgi:hypothetical protein